jgi:hypothetical protein
MAHFFTFNNIYSEVTNCHSSLYAQTHIPLKYAQIITELQVILNFSWKAFIWYNLLPENLNCMIGFLVSIMCGNFAYSSRWDKNHVFLKPFILKEILVNELVGNSNKGRAMVKVVSRRPLIAVARVRAPVNSCGICSGQSGTGTVLRFSPVNISFHRRYPNSYHLGNE